MLGKLEQSAACCAGGAGRGQGRFRAGRAPGQRELRVKTLLPAHFIMQTKARLAGQAALGADKVGFEQGVHLDN